VVTPGNYFGLKFGFLSRLTEITSRSELHPA